MASHACPLGKYSQSCIQLLVNLSLVGISSHSCVTLKGIPGGRAVSITGSTQKRTLNITPTCCPHLFNLLLIEAVELVHISSTTTTLVVSDMVSIIQGPETPPSTTQTTFHLPHNITPPPLHTPYLLDLLLGETVGLVDIAS